VLVGYARVSKADHQDTAAQVKALRQAGNLRGEGLRWPLGPAATSQL